MATKFAWTEDKTAQLLDAIAGKSLVSQDELTAIAADLGHTARGVGSKIRQLVKSGVVSVEVQKAADAHKSAWTESEEASLVDFLNANAGAMTYAEISATFLDGKFTAKQVQGKVLSLEMTDLVKKAEKVVAARTYSEADEAKFVDMANAGDSLEAIAAAMGRPLQSVRGKALSLHREGRINEIPRQEHSTAQVRKDFLDGVDVANLTVEEIAELTGKNPRGIRNTLTRRGLSCKNHDGAAKRQKIDAKAE